MTDKFFNFMFPVGGGSTGAIASIASKVTWSGVWEMALQAAVFAFVGGLIGWGVKRGLDTLFKKKK